MSTIPFYIAGAALLVSLVALWKTHFAAFSPIAVAGSLRHRVYPIKNEDKRWYMSSFEVPISVTNGGARPGLVTCFRLVLRFPKIPIPNAREVIYPKWSLEPAHAKGINQNRFEWIQTLPLQDWMSIAVLPKATILRHVIFETRWDHEVVQEEVRCSLEVSCDGDGSWIPVDEWKLSLNASSWPALISGTTHCYAGKHDVAGPMPTVDPPNLHQYTGTREPLPKMKPIPPSYLDAEIDGESSK